MWNIILFFILCAFFIYLVYCDKKEYLTSKPNDEQINKYTTTILKHKNLFTRGNHYSTAKRYMPWLDAVLYEDLRNLSNKNNFTINHIKSIF